MQAERILGSYNRESKRGGSPSFLFLPPIPLRRGGFKGDALEEFFAGAYGPGNAAILIEVVSDNKNHAIGDIKRVLKEYGAKWAESQSVEWAFEKRQENDGEHRWLWKPKFSQELKNDERERLERLKEELQELPEVYAVHTNTN